MADAQSAAKKARSERRARAQKLFNNTCRAQLTDKQLVELKAHMASLRAGLLETPEFCRKALGVFRDVGSEETLSLLVRGLSDILPPKFHDEFHRMASCASSGSATSGGGGGACAVTDSLYVGGWDTVQKLAPLQREGITHV
eukprot:COSAG05_NODE_10851_length_542_cov_1.309255_1_plen_141_part_10